MKVYIMIALLCWLVVLVIEEVIANYNAKKCGYKCDECLNWHCRKKECAYKRSKK